jgi:hypothetical protein
MTRVPVLDPVPTGVKMMLMVQVLPTTRLSAQVFDSEKSAASAPANWILETASKAFPELDKVKIWGWLAVPRSWPA